MCSNATTAAIAAPKPDPRLRAPLVFVADAADPVTDALVEPLLGSLVADAVALAGDVDGVILGPEPDVIMSPFPPGYVPPAAVVKSCGT